MIQSIEEHTGSFTMETNVEEKVKHLEKVLHSLRDEVDFKMSIMEQILSTRNEQFTVQKKLLEQEHALYETVLDQWRNSDHVNPQVHNKNSTFHDSYSSKNGSYLNTGKRSSTSAAFQEPERTRLRAKRLRGSTSVPPVFAGKMEPATELPTDSQWDLDEESNDSIESAEDPLESEANSGGESEGGELETEDMKVGMEKRVFVNFFNEAPVNEEGSSDPIWLHFLHEEKGTTALCKHCDEKGFQKIYKLRTPSMAVLRKHLKRTHKIVVEAPPMPLPEIEEKTENDRGQGRRRLMPFLRHNDHLYTRYTHRNFVEYWRCREKTCSGKLVKRHGTIHSTGEHNCLTTAQDCDAILFREKIREMAEFQPTLPPSDIIAAAKLGCADEVLELVPNDESLRRTIRRIRLALESAAPSTSDWT